MTNGWLVALVLLHSYGTNLTPHSHCVEKTWIYNSLRIEQATTTDQYLPVTISHHIVPEPLGGCNEALERRSALDRSLVFLGDFVESRKR